MNTATTIFDLRQVPVLLRGEAEPINAWIEKPSAARVWLYLGIITAGAGLFGAAVGCWRAPLQGAYAAIKFPLVILLTTFGNALLNAMLAPLLGLNLGFRQSLLAILMSFTIAAAILGAFSPLMFFLVWNTPPLSPRAGVSLSSHSLILVSQVAAIAFAGVAANLRLIQLLRRLGGRATTARAVLGAWLCGNLFLGSQLSWIFHPFIGSPSLPVEFLREDAFHGGFFETVWHALKHLFF